MANLTDADKVLRNDTGKGIVAELAKIANGLNAPDADKVAYDNTESGLTADNVQDAIDEVEGRVDTAEGSITSLANNKLDKTDPTSTGTLSHTGDATISGSVTANSGFVGNLTGSVTGNVTGDLTGNVTGDVTGNLTGTASNATNADNATNAGNANTVNNLTVLTAVPANAVFTDTDELSNLKDVEFTNLTDGQVIVWNATAGKFKNITLPDPMVFRGSLGTGGTITALPVDGSANIGDTYKVITDGTYAGQPAKIGDTFICLTKTLSANTWVHIPSGDEPSGTVTSIKIEANSPIVVDDDSAITTSGVRKLSHADSGATAGSYGDSTAQTPNYGATFKVPYITVDAKGHITGISEHTVKIPESDNTTYSLTQDSSDGHKITLTPSEGTAQTITIPDNDTTYTLGTDGNNLKLTPSSGSAQTVTVPYATNAGKVNSHTVNSDVPSGAVFTDTTNASGISYDPTTSGLSATNAQNAIDELRGLDPQVKSASGSVATFTDGGDNIPVKSFECEIVAQQGSGTPTPASPLPISGFSQADIGDISDATNITYFKGLLNGTYGFVDLGSLTWTKVTNTSVTAGMYFYATMPDRMVGSINMICSNYFVPDIKGLSNIIAKYGADVDNILFTTNTTSRANIIDSDYTDENDLKAALDGVYLIYELATPTTPTITPEQFKSLCLAFGITSDMFIVSFGQTIYGGRLIYANGQWAIEADKAMKLISDLDWYYNEPSTRFAATDLRDIIKNAESTLTPLEGLSCECYVNDVASSSRQIDLSIAVSTSGIMVLKDTNYNDVSSLLNAVGNYKIVYPLETPTIIPITSSTRVKTISGDNNIYSNTGDCELEYFTDGCDSIVELVEQVVAYTEVTGTLTAGQTSITLSDASITTTSTIDIYTDVFGIQPTNAVVATGSITLTFLAQASDINVKVRVS